MKWKSPGFLLRKARKVWRGIKFYLFAVKIFWPLIFVVLFNSFRNNVRTWLSSKTLLPLLYRNIVFCRDWRNTTQGEVCTAVRHIQSPLSRGKPTVGALLPRLYLSPLLELVVPCSSPATEGIETPYLRLKYPTKNQNWFNRLTMS